MPRLLALQYNFELFFFQAEDGIRDLYVTGVQTCALPICVGQLAYTWNNGVGDDRSWPSGFTIPRSEERRVGKECRSRWSPDKQKKNNCFLEMTMAMPNKLSFSTVARLVYVVTSKL